MRAFKLIFMSMFALGQISANPVQVRQNSILAACPVTGTSLDAGYNVTEVMRVALENSLTSEDFGTYSVTLLELYNPELTVYDANPFPQGRLPAVFPNMPSLLAAETQMTLDGPLIAANDTGRPASPATLGIAAIQLGRTNATYMDAAKRQAQYLFDPTILGALKNGAVATKTGEAWAEQIWDAAPFLAYYAVATRNTTLLNETINQIGLYREMLQNQTSSEYRWWYHVSATGSDKDMRPWSTGNGFAALGMARVLATVMHWGTSSGWSTEQAKLKAWIKEIMDAVRDHGDRKDPGFMINPPSRVAQDEQGLMQNYLTNPGTGIADFGEVTGTGLLASVFYRMLVLAPEAYGSKDLAYAELSRKSIANHYFSNGVLSPAANPQNPQSEDPDSSGPAVAQNAGGLMYAAYRDCVCAGRCQ